jgi:hypothetical protein
MYSEIIGVLTFILLPMFIFHIFFKFLSNFKRRKGIVGAPRRNREAYTNKHRKTAGTGNWNVKENVIN